MANADSYRGDIGSVSVCGDSAGGNFSAALCLMSRDRRGPAIHKQILLYPATTFLLNERTESEKHYGNGNHFLIINSELGMVNDYFCRPERRGASLCLPAERREPERAAPRLLHLGRVRPAAGPGADVRRPAGGRGRRGGIPPLHRACCTPLSTRPIRKPLRLWTTSSPPCPGLTARPPTFRKESRKIL